MPGKRTEFEFDIAVSFAGENRAIVEQFATLLRDAGKEVFYDRWEQADLWGKDLYQHLDDVYRHKARYCAIFISSAYAAKAWTNHELKSAQARAFQENQEYILPVRLDDTQLPGIRETVGYIDLRHVTVDNLAEMVIAKLNGSAASEKRSTRAKPKQPTGRKKAEETKKPKPTRSIVVADSQDWVLLADHFYRAISIDRPDDKHIVVNLLPTDAQADSQLENLRPQRYSSAKPISFAYANDAFVVRCELATSTYEAPGHKWQIKLVKEDVDYGGGVSEAAYGDAKQMYSPDDLARLRGERILLGFPEEKPAQRGVLDVSGRMLESFIQGNHTHLKVTACPIQVLAKAMPRDDAELFMRYARLISLYYLKASGVVERIERLTLGPLKNTSLHVAFRGVRKSRYSNVAPAIIEIEGDCPLGEHAS